MNPVFQNLFQTKARLAATLATTFVLLGAAAVPVLLPGAGAQSPEGTLVSIEDASAGQFQSVTVPIVATNVTNFGTGTVQLAVDMSVVTVQGVFSGHPSMRLQWASNNSTGVTTILVTYDDRAGWNGDFVFANVTLNTVGAPGTTSPLNLTITEWADPEGAALSATDSDGTFRAGILGDVDGDGVVDDFDATTLGDYVVGRENVTIIWANSEVSGDGLVTGVDVMFIRQHLAGDRVLG